MAFRRPSSQLAETSTARPDQESAPGFDQAPPEAQTAPVSGVTLRDWPGDEIGFIAEVLRAHALPESMVERLMALATAPVHAPRLVDRLAIALAGHFHFLPVEDVLKTPILLYGAPGSGASTLAAKLAAKFDERQILVISTDTRGAAAMTQLEENLEVLGLPLAAAADAQALKSTVESASGRMVIIDTACGAPTDPAGASRIQKYVEAAGAQGTLVLSANATAEEAAAIAKAATQIGTRQMIVTQLDTARFIGSTLIAAEAGKLALVAASVTPHFAFGLRALTPENLARRLMAAILKSERWRIAPL
jgi:flagellar biosynthesis GTPase FlhF